LFFGWQPDSHRHNLRDRLGSLHLQFSWLDTLYDSDLMHNVSQLLCVKSSFWGGGEFGTSLRQSMAPWRCCVWCKGMRGTYTPSIQNNPKYVWESWTHQPCKVPPCLWCETQHPKSPSWWHHDVVFIFYMHV
jgi:hypothetical protein